MQIIFTKSNSAVSRLIRWISNEPVSHVAIVFDGKLVFHSNLLGVHIKWYNSFKKHNEIVFEKTYDLSLDKEEELYQQIINQFDEAPYDYGALLYFTYRGCLYKFFGLPMPKNNILGSKQAFLCSEILGCLGNYVIPKPEFDLQITTPYQIYLWLK